MKLKYKYYLMAVIVILIFPIMTAFASNSIGFYTKTAQIPEDNEKALPNTPEIEGEAAVLIDAKTGIIIYEKNKDIAKYPASITKILTALIVLENTQLDEKVVFSHEAVFSLPYGSSHIAMDEGESLTINQALYAILLASANEVSNGVAEHIGGSNEGFAEIMNQKAKEIGANNTHFTNPHGLHDEKHYTTAYDMALIMKEAIKNPKFVEIISTLSTEIPPTEKQTEIRPLNNSHKMISPASPNYYEYAIGGKTGFTSEAGNTLVTYAKQDDKELIAVILKDTSAQNAYSDTAKLFDYGFSSFSFIKILDHEKFQDKLSIPFNKDGKLAEAGTVSVYADESVTMYLPSQVDAKDLEFKVNAAADLTAPVTSGQKVGTVDIIYKGILLSSVDVFSKDSVAVPVLKDNPANSDNVSKKDSVFSKIDLKSFGISVLKSFSILVAVLLVIAVTARVYRYIKRMQRKKNRARRSVNSARKIEKADNGRRTVEYRNYRYR